MEEPVFGAATPHLAEEKTREGVTVVTPHLSARGDDDQAEVERLIGGLVDDHQIRDPWAWFYTPMALPLARRLEPRVTVYDCMDELSLFRGAPPGLAANEETLLRQADLVFTGGQSLYEAKRGRHPHVHVFPSSVDAAHFATARGGGLTLPDDEAAIPTPRVGYFGVVDERIDLPLLVRLADARPDLHVVVVGPLAKLDPNELPRRPNLHYLGPKKYDDLPAHLAAWDVAIMPFARNDATRFISPTKTLEYLAAGKAVVSTPIRDVVRPYGEAGVVRIGEGDEFVTRVDEALRERGTPAAHARRAEADAPVAGTSWDRTWKGMEDLIEGVSSRRRHDGRTRSEKEGETQCSTT